MYSPVVLFVYNRLDDVKQSLSALALNTIAKETEVYIFSDGPKNEQDTEKVAAVREYISQDTWKEKFSTVNIIMSAKNRGLANSIISGVDQIIRQYGRVIVLEDDCISTVDFLEYMNSSLDFYEKSDRIWSIGGYSVNLTFPSDYMHDVYIMGRTCSYAWATWIDRWEKVDWNVSDYDAFKRDFKQRRAFNKYGNDRAKMLDLQRIGRTNSWAIRFCYAMFKNKQYTLYPVQTKIKNSGYRGGTHKLVGSSEFEVELPNQIKKIKLENVDLDDRLIKQYARKFYRPWYILAFSYMRNVVLQANGRGISSKN